MTTTGSDVPELSVALVAGRCRERARRVVAAVAEQTASAAIELVIVDLARNGEPPLAPPQALRTTYVARPRLERFGAARAEAVRAARAPVVAFIEDHCLPAPDWAARLIEAHRGPWAGVGYAFTNANPRTWASRAALLARYGTFVHPARHGAAAIVSGSNVSYKRAALLDLGDSLDDLLDIDFNLQEALVRVGGAMFVESRALAAHENYETIAGECRAGRPYCRLLAARRARAGGWGRPRRIAMGLAVPLAAPALRLLRLVASLRDRRELWGGFFEALPGVVALYVSDALGESAGYLLGEGRAPREVLACELDAERSVS